MVELKYSDYVELCQSQEDIFGADQYYKRRNKKIRPISERKFNTLKNVISDKLDQENYTSRDEAQEDLEIKIQQMGPTTFFLLRVLIGWIIGKLLDLYFDRKKLK